MPLFDVDQLAYFLWRLQRRWLNWRLVYLPYNYVCTYVILIINQTQCHMENKQVISSARHTSSLGEETNSVTRNSAYHLSVLSLITFLCYFKTFRSWGVERFLFEDNLRHLWGFSPARIGIESRLGLDYPILPSFLPGYNPILVTRITGFSGANRHLMFQALSVKLYFPGLDLHFCRF